MEACETEMNKLSPRQKSLCDAADAQRNHSALSVSVQPRFLHNWDPLGILLAIISIG